MFSPMNSRQNSTPPNKKQQQTLGEEKEEEEEKKKGVKEKEELNTQEQDLAAVRATRTGGVETIVIGFKEAICRMFTTALCFGGR